SFFQSSFAPELHLVLASQLDLVLDDDPNAAAARVERPARQLGGARTQTHAVGDLPTRAAASAARGVDVALLRPCPRGQATPLCHRANLAEVLPEGARFAGRRGPEGDFSVTFGVLT